MRPDWAVPVSLRHQRKSSSTLIVAFERNRTLATSTEKGQSWRAHNVVKQESSVNEQNEAQNLQPFERLPSKAERDDPDSQRSASVDGAACRG
jgi:hypothetical protein